MSYRALIPYLSSSGRFPELYLLLVLCALLPFSFFISFQLFQLLKRDILLRQVKQDLLNVHYDAQLFTFVSVLVNKKLWLDAIKIMEKNCRLRDLSLHRYFNALGFVYYSMQQYNLARIYYTKALGVKKNYLAALLNLAKLYRVTKEPVFLASTCRSILQYDPTNRMASRYLDSIID